MRRLHLKPLEKLSAPQRRLLEDACAGVMEPTRYGWRLRGKPLASVHQGRTVESLTVRRFMAIEHGLLFITPKGRDLLAAQQAEASNVAA
jgi:hypothetical protein